MSPISIAQLRSKVTKGSLRGEPEQQKEPSRHIRRNVPVWQSYLLSVSEEQLQFAVLVDILFERRGFIKADSCLLNSTGCSSVSSRLVWTFWFLFVYQLLRTCKVCRRVVERSSRRDNFKNIIVIFSSVELSCDILGLLEAVEDTWVTSQMWWGLIANSTSDLELHDAWSYLKAMLEDDQSTADRMNASAMFASYIQRYR